MVCQIWQNRWDQPRCKWDHDVLNKGQETGNPSQSYELDLFIYVAKPIETKSVKENWLICVSAYPGKSDGVS